MNSVINMKSNIKFKFGDLFTFDRDEETSRDIACFKFIDYGRTRELGDHCLLRQRFDICQFIEIVEVNVDGATRHYIKFVSLSHQLFLYVHASFNSMMIKL
jgi:hypothetical protein